MTNLGLDHAPKRTRESTSKVRTGCSTWKARRVKCDEAKPICQKCTSGRRQCQYIAVHKPRNIITVYLPPPRSPSSLLENSRDLNFFRQNLAAKLDGQLHSSFWSKLVLQLAPSEASVRHAVATLSILYQDVALSLQHPAGYVKANPEAQKEWDRSVKALSIRIAKHPESSLVPLVCCLLFACVELLRGSVDSFLLHIENGFNILVPLQRPIDAASVCNNRMPSSELEVIDDHIVPVFTRLNLLCSLAGKMTPPVHARHGSEQAPHANLTDSRVHLFQISDVCIRFIRKSSPKAAVFQVDIDDFIEQAKLQSRLDAWYDKFTELHERLKAAGTLNRQAFSLLMVHHRVVHIWLRVCTTAAEIATDSYLLDFEIIVDHAEQQSAQCPTVVPQPLAFDIQTIGPLYYTALKCRHPVVRRKALGLLRLAPRREGLWNAHHAYATAKRVIELEERHMDGATLPEEAWRLHGLHLPNDENHIYNYGDMPFDNQKHRHGIVPSPSRPGILEAVFQHKPYGLFGEFEAITEYIKL